MSWNEGAIVRPARDVWQSMVRGMRCRCPSCGVGRMFSRYLKVTDHCSECGEALFHHRADDAPPYFTISIVGHIVVALVLWVEVAWAPPVWVHMTLWLPLTLALSLLFLPPIKGSIVGLQWAWFMHGFGGEEDFFDKPPPEPSP